MSIFLLCRGFISLLNALEFSILAFLLALMLFGKTMAYY